MNQKQVMVGTLVFLFLFAMNKNELRGKSVRKKIIRQIKMKLAQYRATANIKQYNENANRAFDIISATRDRMDDRGASLYICPGSFLSHLHFRYEDLISPYDIPDEWIKSLVDAFEENKLTLHTVKYTNILIEEMEKDFATNIAPTIEQHPDKLLLNKEA